jgi:hypothetical protein
MVLCFVGVRGSASSFPALDTLLKHQPQASPHQLETAWLSEHPMLVRKKNDGIVIRDRVSPNRTGLFLVAIILLYVFAGFRLAFGKNLQEAFSWLRMAEDKSNNRRSLNTGIRHAGVFNFIYLTCLSYVLYHYIASAELPFGFHSKGAFLLFSIGMCFGLYILKYLLQRLLVWTFLKEEVYEDYYSNLTSITQIASVILFPVCILMLLSNGRFFQVVLYIGLFLIGVFTLWRYARMIGSLKKMMSIDFLHFFLYLCAFEILPILAAGRFMIR